MHQVPKAGSDEINTKLILFAFGFRNANLVKKFISYYIDVCPSGKDRRCSFLAGFWRRSRRSRANHPATVAIAYGEAPGIAGISVLAA